jgi:putative hydrolase of the HAD superfamily
MKKAIILDLDNTIYDAPSIGEAVFAPIFQLIEDSDIPQERIPAIKADMMRKPFQVVAVQQQFSPELTQKGIALLSEIDYQGKIQAFSDYGEIKSLPVERFLVTTGFSKLQYSKIRALGIEQDFKEVHVIDPTNTNQTKQTVFADILERHHYTSTEVLVVGDDPESEIKAAIELGIEAVLYDKFNRYPSHQSIPKVGDFKELLHLL